MDRCLELARKGTGFVAPNPLVGAVLVHEDRIIGEGWHEVFGGPHAEVNAIQNAIQNGHTDLLVQSTLYVSLEPCSHHGKTPPCTELILRHRIPRVVIGTPDPFHRVNGPGIEKLRNAGVEVLTGILDKECGEQNRRFICFHTRHRPYIILKWAQTADGFMAREGEGNSRLYITNETTQRLVHRWRSEESAILVGKKTALLDDPELTNRFWPGPSPVRCVMDSGLSLPGGLKLFDNKSPTIIYNKLRDDENGNTKYVRIAEEGPPIPFILDHLYQSGLQSLIVEGGAALIQSFIREGYWDEARVLVNTKLQIGAGLTAPDMPSARLEETGMIQADQVRYYKPIP